MSLLKILLIGAVLWLPTAQAQEPNIQRHMVRPGETLTQIAEGYGLDVNVLAQFNKLDVNQLIRVGQLIYFPYDAEAMGEPMQPPRMDAREFPDAVGRVYGKEAAASYSYDDFQAAQNQPLNDWNFTVPKPPPVAPAKNIEPAQLATPPQNNNNPYSTSSIATLLMNAQPYSFYGNNENIRAVLEDFAGNYSLPIVLSSAVSGSLQGKIGPVTPVQFLDYLGNVHGLMWYFDGHTLFVYNGGESIQRILNLNHLATSELKQTLQQIGIWDERFYWKEQANEGLVFVSGPPRYVELTNETAMILDNKEGERRMSDLVVRTFELKYAWAVDKSFNFRGQELTVPGVATLVQQIVAGGGIARAESNEAPSQGVQPLAAMGEEVQEAAEALNAGTTRDGVYINADPRMNAVIVHDLESKMAMYEELISSLDKPTSQIEISVSIIDINTSDVDALGINWSSTGDTNIQFNAVNPETYSTILGQTFGSFTANIQMLEEDGRAKIISRPSILTLDNLEAVLDNSSTSYVKVESNDDAKLFPVTSGTVVQVTPRIVQETFGRRIHMSVNIQDGNQTTEDATVNAPSPTPVTTNSSISTQAIISEQESLLIGGFYKETEQEGTNKIPLLGDIPLVGRLFRGEETKKEKLVRLFLITPRIIEVNQS